MENDVMVVGWLMDNILKGLLGSLKPDFTKLDKEKLKQGVGLALDSLKPTMSGSLDDMLLDAAKNALAAVIDGLGVASPSGPLVVGAKKKRSKEEVEELIRAEGGDPKTFAPWILLVLQFLPTALDLIKRLLGK